MNAAAAAASPKETLAARLRRQVAAARFLTISLLLHCIVVLLAGSVVLFHVLEAAPDFSAEGGNLVGEQSDALAEDAAPKLEEAQLQVQMPTSNAPAIEVLTTTGASSLTLASASSSMRGLGTEGLAEKVNNLGKGLVVGQGAGRMGGTMMNFFNTKANAQSVVFVVDVSGSMLSSPKSVQTYEVLEKEVAKVLRGLPATAKFGVVVFSREARAFREQLISATSDDKVKAINWLKKMSPEVTRDPRTSEDERQFHHGTRADLGLERAFAMQPDVIFFASDGEPTGVRPPQILEKVQALQKELPRPTVVNVVAYLADGGQPFMRDLAKQNQGTFREITLADVK
jgi:ABC-type arginine transport system ATPase subunit